MRALALALLVVLAACDAPKPQLRQVTIESPPQLGLSLRELPSSVLRASGVGYGLAVVKAGILARRAGLRVGDIIYAVNQQRLHTIEDFTRLVAEQPGGSIALLVRRGTNDLYLPMDLSGIGALPGEGPAPIAPPSRDTLLRT